MAAVAAAARLTEAHRLAQAAIGRRTVDNMLAAFTLLEPSDLAGSTPRWLAVAVPIIRTRQRQSAGLAANYLTVFRSLELPRARPVTPTFAEIVSAEQLATSLVVTGPAALRGALTRDVPIANAISLAAGRAAGAGMRYALNGGRETTSATIRDDSAALGYARVASGNPCAFCAMLASRGPVYSAEAAEADSGYHDRCSCTLEPVYRHDTAWPAGSEQYRDLWHEAKTSKDEDISDFTAFRRLVEGRA